MENGGVKDETIRKDAALLGAAASAAAQQGASSGKHHKRMRMWLTVSVIMTWLGMGLFGEISGPTLTFLKLRINVNYEEISRALVARSAGYLIGSLLAGILCEKWKKQTFFCVAVSLVLGGVATGFEPWCQSLAALATLFFLDGLAKGVIATGGNFLLFMMWKSKAAVPTHALHCAFGVGALLGPQIAKPYLPAETDCFNLQGITEQISNNISSLQSVSSNSSEPMCYEGEEAIEYPYLIVGLTVAVMGLYMLFLHCVVIKFKFFADEEVDKTKDGCLKSDGLCVNVQNSKSYLMVLLILFFLLWSLPVGAERAYGKFLFAFSTDSELQFGPQTASDLMIVFWSTFTAGRALASILSHWLGQFHLLFLELTVGVSSSIVLAICGHREEMALWVCTAFFAATLSPIYPGSISWTNEFLPMTPLLTALAYVGTGAGAIAFSWFSGYLFQFYGPRSLMFFMLFYTIFATVLVISIHAMTRIKPVVMKKSDEDEDEERTV